MPVAKGVYAGDMVGLESPDFGQTGHCDGGLFCLGWLLSKKRDLIQNMERSTRAMPDCRPYLTFHGSFMLSR